MECPICKVKVMTDRRVKRDIMHVRCIKCGREFIIKKGRIEQKKVKRIKKIKKRIKKGVCIQKGISPGDSVMRKQEFILRQHKQVQQQLDFIRQIELHKKQKP